MRARPESTTATTPSMVTEVSATLVERITLRREEGRTARSCSSGLRSPWSGSTSTPESARPASLLGAPADLGAARQEDQQVAVGLLAQQPLHRPRDAVLEPVVGAGGLLGREVLDGHVEAAPLRAEGGGAQEGGHRRGVERGRHGHQPQVGPAGALQAAQQRQGQVAVQVALVELVEQDGADAGEGGLGEEAAQQQPLGDEADAGARRGDVLEADLVADRLAGPLAQLLGHPPGRQPGRQAPRLQHHHLALHQPGGVDRGRDARGLAGAGGRLDDQRRRRRGARPRSRAGAGRWGGVPPARL